MAVAAPAMAHDVSYTLHGTGDARVIFDYQDGSPMAGAEFAVFAPASATASTFSGITGTDGGVAFKATADGIWRIEVHDAAGHASRARIRILDGVPSLAAHAIPLWVTAASVVGNLLLISNIWRRRRARFDTLSR